MLTNEEKAMVMAMAGPFAAELATIENTTYDEQGYKINNGLSVKDQLARTLQRDFGSPARPPEPQYNGMFMPPDIASLDPSFFTAPPMPVYPQAIPQPVQQQNDGQLEFQFNKGEQAKTNDLLETISKKLTKIIQLLESNKPSASNTNTGPR